ncbi:MAG: ATP-binding protein [Nitrospinales bacterium]
MVKTYLLGFILSTAIFILDLSMELGVAGGVPYIFVVLLGLFSNNKKYFVVAGGTGVLFSVLGFYFSPDGGELWKVLTNRSYAIFAIIITTILCYTRIENNVDLKSIIISSQENVKNRSLEIIVLSLVMFLSIVSLSKYLLNEIKGHFDSEMETTIKQMLSSREAMLKIWSVDRQADIKAWASNQEIKDITEKILPLSDDVKKLTNSSELNNLRNILVPFLDRFNYDGFFIISPSYKNIESLIDSNLGIANLLKDQPEFLSKIFAGETKFSLPIKSDVDLSIIRDETTSHQASMFLATPIINESDKVIAALIFRLNPAKGFTDIFQLGATGRRAETYAFNANGKMLSTSRFLDHLRKLKLISPTSNGILEVDIRDPGGNLMEGFKPKVDREKLPLTIMANTALKHGRGFSLTGYRDYRGVPVIGAWTWNDEFNFGITSEIDFEEAFQPFRIISEVIFYLVLLAGVSIVAFSSLIIISRNNAIRYAQKLRENEVNLIKAKEIAERSNHAKSDFLSKMSHELRTPMNAILGFAQLLDMDTRSPLTPKQKNNLGHISSAGKHLLSLITKVLDLASIESGSIKLSIERTDIVPLVDNVISIAKPLAGEKGISIEYVEIPMGNYYAKVDPVRFKQIILNLISNAIKYNKPNGSIKISYDKTSDEWIRLGIRDTGRGIPEDKKGLLFKPFERFDENSEKIEGTGIGLTIAKQIIEMMQGKIGFESKVGEGNFFYIDLPVAKKPLMLNNFENMLSSTEPTSTNGKNKKVLYIEDIAANVELVKQILISRPQINLMSAPDAFVGIEMARKEIPDLILMDINLPKMDGITAFQELQTYEDVKDIPVYALTANAMDTEINKALNLGFRDYITKPINVKTFLTSIDKVC